MRVTHDIGDVLDELERIGNRADDNAELVVDRNSADLVDAAQGVTPVGETGKLRDAWSFRRGSVHNSARYAGFQEGLAGRAKAAILNELEALRARIASEVSDG